MTVPNEVILVFSGLINLLVVIVGFFIKDKLKSIMDTQKEQSKNIQSLMVNNATIMKMTTDHETAIKDMKKNFDEYAAVQNRCRSCNP